MRSFRRHLTEIYGLKSVKDLVFSNLDGGEVALPISKMMFTRLTSEKKRVRSIHVTDFEGFDNLLPLLGTRKQIATMTKAKFASVVKLGVSAGGGIAVVLEGYPVFESSYDLHTKVDSQGRRWIEVDMISDVTKDPNIEKTLLGALHVVRAKIIKEIQQKFKFRVDFWDYLHISLPDRRKEKEEDDELRDAGLLSRTASRRKIQGYAIKRYMDLVETMVWKPYISEVIELLSGIPEAEKGQRSPWNEIDLVDTEIVEVHVLKFDIRGWVIDGGGDPDDPDDDMLAFIDEDDMEYHNKSYNGYVRNGYHKKYKTIIVNNIDISGMDENAQDHFEKLFMKIQRYNNARR